MNRTLIDSETQDSAANTANLSIAQATPDFGKWHKVVEGAGRDLLSIYPPETQVIRQFFVKTEAIEGGDGVLAGIIFANDALPEVIKFFDDKTNPLFQQGP